jgi:hypothetical protein
MCAMFGGIAGQEVLKAISGKYTPISQWLYFDRCACPLVSGPFVAFAICGLNTIFSKQYSWVTASSRFQCLCREYEVFDGLQTCNRP